MKPLGIPNSLDQLQDVVVLLLQKVQEFEKQQVALQEDVSALVLQQSNSQEDILQIRQDVSVLEDRIDSVSSYPVWSAGEVTSFADWADQDERE